MLTVYAAASQTSNYSSGYSYLDGLSWFHPSYILVIIGLIITLIASAKVKSAFNKYNSVASRRGITGAECARRILDANGLHHIQIQHIAGQLTDNYNPKTGVVSLSESTFGSTSIAALGVAAHECGHAVQHAVGYAPIRVRNGIYPVVNICSHAAIPIIIIGILLSQFGLSLVGVVLYCAVLVFQLVTIPTETDASSRALKTLEGMALLDEDELKGAKKVLTAAAMTYFASAAATALTILRFLLIIMGNSRSSRK